MDAETRETIDAFVAFLEKNFLQHKHYNQVQLEKWSLKDFKITIKFFFRDKEDKLYFDVREVKENREHFDHLLSNAISQLHEKFPVLT